MQKQVKGDLSDIGRQQLDAQLALIQDAQRNEIAGAQKAGPSPAQAVAAMLAQLQSKADALFHSKGSQGLTGFLEDPTMKAIQALTSQLSAVTNISTSTVTTSNSMFNNFTQNVQTSAPITPADVVHLRAMASV